MAKVLDIDGNGNVGALSDGLLILRYLAGYRGNDLISGLIAPGATRTTERAIVGYIESIYPLLDIDGNGFVGVHSDGFLILRAMFGFTGSVLVAGGIVEPGASRTPEQMTAYFATLVA